MFSDGEGESGDEVLSKEAGVGDAVSQELFDNDVNRGFRDGDASQHGVNFPKEMDPDPVAEALSVVQSSKNEPETMEGDQKDCEKNREKDCKEPTGDIVHAGEGGVSYEPIEGEVLPNDADGSGLGWILLIALGVIVVVGAGVALFYLIKIL